MSPEEIQGWLQIGIGGLMFVALLLGYRHVWIFGWQYDDLLKDRDEWKAMALRGLGAAEEVVKAAVQHSTLSPAEAEKARRLIREADGK